MKQNLISRFLTIANVLIHAGKIGRECVCLPGCTEFKFDYTMSNAVLSKANNLKFEDNVKEALPDLDNDDFVRDNVAVVHIYYENQHFLMHERGVVCTVTY